MTLCGINVETRDSCSGTQCRWKMGGQLDVGGHMRGTESVAASVSILGNICAQKFLRMLVVLPFAS